MAKEQQNKKEEIGFFTNLDSAEKIQSLENQSGLSSGISPASVIVPGLEMAKNSHKILGYLSMFIGCAILFVAWYFNILDKFNNPADHSIFNLNPIIILFSVFFIGGFAQIYTGAKRPWLAVITLILITVAVVAGLLYYMWLLDPTSLSGQNISVPSVFFAMVIGLFILMIIVEAVAKRKNR